MDGDGNKLAEPCVKEVPEGSGFSIVSPTLTHLVPDRAVVDGTMDTQDIAVTVTYSDNDCVITYIYNYKNRQDAKYQTVWCGEETQLLAFPFNLSKIKNERYMG